MITSYFSKKIIVCQKVDNLYLVMQSDHIKGMSHTQPLFFSNSQMQTYSTRHESSFKIINSFLFLIIYKK